MIQFCKKFIGSKSLIIAIIMLLMIGITSVIYLSNIAYAIKVDEQVIGIVKNKEEIYQLIEEIKGTYEKDWEKELKINQKITHDRIFASKSKVTPKEQLKSELEQNLVLKTEAYALTVNGEELIFLKHKQSAEELLNRVKNTYVQQINDTQVKEVSFIEEVEITQKDIELAFVTNLEDAYQYILTGTDSVEKYVVQEGDTAWDIAVKYDMMVEDIMQANPGIDLEKLQIGQELTLTAPKPFINVKVVETTTYEERIFYQVEYETTDSLYLGEQKIKQKGIEGKKEVTAELVTVNGIFENKNILKTEIVQQPQTQIILKGTKARPKTAAYGVFYMPSRGSISSRFGSRWGRTHNGIDIAGNTGAPIKAADGGTVTFAGWQSGYGNLVIVNHGNGYVTYYGHCNTLKVKKGEKVYRGQIIATVGATGNVTGPHLHFEIRKNGTPLNPEKFLGQ